MKEIIHKNARKRHIGLVLSGGMGKGAYQVGALTAINEFFRPRDFECVSAASIGVLNTYAFLTGNLEMARMVWETVNPQGNKRFITSVLKEGFLQEIISKIVSDVRISNSFFVPLVDLANRELDYYNLKDVGPDEEIELYLQASIAMPFYSKGVKIGDKTLFDGAIVDNIPIYPVLKDELDYVICIYFDDCNYVFEDYSLEHKIIKLTFPDNKRLSPSVIIQHDSILRMINEGYIRTQQILDSIFGDGIDSLETIYQRIAARNHSDAEKAMRVTGDVVVTNMNKVAKKLLHHKQIVDVRS